MPRKFSGTLPGSGLVSAGNWDLLVTSSSEVRSTGTRCSGCYSWCDAYVTGRVQIKAVHKTTRVEDSFEWAVNPSSAPTFQRTLPDQVILVLSGIVGMAGTTENCAKDAVVSGGGTFQPNYTLTTEEIVPGDIIALAPALRGLGLPEGFIVTNASQIAADLVANGVGYSALVSGAATKTLVELLPPTAARIRSDIAAPWALILGVRAEVLSVIAEDIAARMADPGTPFAPPPGLPPVVLSADRVAYIRAMSATGPFEVYIAEDKRVVSTTTNPSSPFEVINILSGQRVRAIFGSGFNTFVGSIDFAIIASALGLQRNSKMDGADVYFMPFASSALYVYTDVVEPGTETEKITATNYITASEWSTPEALAIVVAALSTLPAVLRPSPTEVNRKTGCEGLGYFWDGSRCSALPPKEEVPSQAVGQPGPVIQVDDPVVAPPREVVMAATAAPPREFPVLPALALAGGAGVLLYAISKRRR